MRVSVTSVGMADVPIQRIAVPTFEHKDHPTPHVVYLVQVTTPECTWSVQRRYTDFCQLHEQITPPETPAPLPPKHRLKQSWRAVTSLGGILAVSDAQKNEDERDIEQRRGALEKYLRAIIASPSPFWRESDAFMKFVDMSAYAPEQPQTKTPASKMPHASLSTYTRSESYGEQALRPWRDAQALSIARETDTTRSMTDAELLQHQSSTLMASQDEQANSLAAILRRQREIGLHIHDELNVHRELLGSLHTDLQRTQSHMHAANAYMKQLNQK